MINCFQSLKGVPGNEKTSAQKQGRYTRSSFEGKSRNGVERGSCRGPGRAQATGESHCSLAGRQGHLDTAGRNRRIGSIIRLQTSEEYRAIGRLKGVRYKEPVMKPSTLVATIF